MEKDSTNWFVKDFVVKHFPHIRKEAKFSLFDLYFPEICRLSIAMEFPEILPFIAGIVSFLVAGGLGFWITKQPAGTKEMMAYL